MDRLEKFNQVALACYGQAISSTEQQAIDFDPGQTSLFRAQLQALASQAGQATTPEALQDVQQLFRAELQKYRDSAQEQIRRLRLDVDAAALALEEFAGHTTTSGDDHEKTLKQSLQRLDSVATSGRLEEVKEAIRSASAGILASFDQMRASSQLAVAQLKDEIRLLHQKLDPGGRAARQESAPPAPAAPAPMLPTVSSPELDARIALLLRQNSPFCVVLVVLRNLNSLAVRSSPAVVAEGLECLESRLRGILGRDAMVKRRSARQFVAILTASPRDAMALSRDLAHKLAEPFFFEKHGVSQTISFQLSAGMLDHRADADPAKFHDRLEKLALTLAGSTE
jgi:GGDEF domain-containing protein